MNSLKIKHDIFDYIVKVGELYFWQKNSLTKVPGMLSKENFGHMSLLMQQYGLFFDRGETKDAKLKYWSEDTETVSPYFPPINLLQDAPRLDTWAAKVVPMKEEEVHESDRENTLSQSSKASGVSEIQVLNNQYQRLNDRKRELFLKKGEKSFFTKKSIQELEEKEIERNKPKIEDDWRKKKEFKDQKKAYEKK